MDNCFEASRDITFHSNKCIVPHINVFIHTCLDKEVNKVIFLAKFVLLIIHCYKTSFVF